MTLCRARRRRFLGREKFKVLALILSDDEFSEATLTRPFGASGVETTQPKNNRSLVFLDHLTEKKEVIYLFQCIGICRPMSFKEAAIWPNHLADLSDLLAGGRSLS